MTRTSRVVVSLTALLALVEAAPVVAQSFPRALAKPRQLPAEIAKVAEPPREPASGQQVEGGRTACDPAVTCCPDAQSSACAELIRSGLKEAIRDARVAGEFDEVHRAAYRGIEGRLESALRQMSLADDARKWARAMTTGIAAVSDLRRCVDPAPTSTCGQTGTSGQGAQRGTELQEFTKGQWPERRKQLAKLVTHLEASAMLGPPASQLDTKSLEFLGGAGFSAGTAVPEVTVRAVDVFFTNRWRLHVRTTVPISTDDDAAEASAGDGEAGEDGEAEPEPSAADIDDSVKSALLNPTGGLLNVAAGYYRKLPAFVLTGAADDASHGLFLDARAGVRFLETPDETLRNADGPSSLSPLLSASVGMWLVLPVFGDAGLTTSAGKVGLNVAYLVNHFTSTSSALLRPAGDKPPVLERTTKSVFVGAALKLTTFADISISGTLWSSTDFNRRLMVSIGLVNDK